MKFSLIGLAAALAVGGACNAKVLTVQPGGDAHEAIQTALLDAKPGDVVQLAAGRYDLSDSLSLDVSDVTLRGAGAGKTILAFDAQKGGAEGVLVTSSRVVVRDLSIQNAKGNGLKFKGGDQVSMVNLVVEWTAGPKTSNGAYGVYPVDASNVLIRGVTVRGASDAGIYVGQSRNIIVEHSKAEFNVAGIEIENCWNADVRENLATHNAGGILVFDLPGLPQQGGHAVRVYHNASVDNDTQNFGAPGATVSEVPTGTGVMVMANRDVHVFENRIAGNATGAILVVAYQKPFENPAYNPLARDIDVHHNSYGRNGWAPAFPGGAELVKAIGRPLPPVTWDGVTRADLPGGKASTDVVKVDFLDGPVLNLRLVTQGVSLTRADPHITGSLRQTSIPQPAAVVLPAAQLAAAAAP